MSKKKCHQNRQGEVRWRYHLQLSDNLHKNVTIHNTPYQWFIYEHIFIFLTFIWDHNFTLTALSGFNG